MIWPATARRRAGSPRFSSRVALGALPEQSSGGGDSSRVALGALPEQSSGGGDSSRFALGALPEPGGHREGERMIHAARVEKRLLRVLPATLLLVLAACCSMGTPEGSLSPVVPMVKVKFVVRNGQTMQEIPSDGWTARIELPQDSSAAVI